MSSNIEKIYQQYLSSAGVSTDSRAIKPGELFFALQGAHFDGHLFVKEVFAKGAIGCIVHREEACINNRCYLVDDTLQTMQRLANLHRSQLGVKIIAVTGSNGKTTTKELLFQVLSKKYNVLATSGNLNNHIGLPLTLLKLKTTHEIGVIEMGANHQREIDFLCKIAMPDEGLITNIGYAHLEGFGGFEGVIKGKTELYNHLIDHQKKIYLNQDNEILTNQVGSYNFKVSYGYSPVSDYQFQIIEEPNAAVKWIKNPVVFSSNLYGKFHGLNLMAAITIGLEHDVTVEDIQEALIAYTPQNNRSQWINWNQHRVLLDAYNANPSSMIAVVEEFSKLEGRPKILILGDMLELGSQSLSEHKRILDIVMQHKWFKVLLVGKLFHQVSTENPDIELCGSIQDVKDWISTNINQPVYMLLKGSRRIALEKLVLN